MNLVRLLASRSIPAWPDSQTDRQSVHTGHVAV